MYQIRVSVLLWRYVEEMDPANSLHASLLDVGCCLGVSVMILTIKQWLIIQYLHETSFSIIESCC